MYREMDMGLWLEQAEINSSGGGQEASDGGD
jgi:hypothetical protein